MADTTAATKEELDHQLSLAVRSSSKQLTDDFNNTKSAYLVHETSEPDSFMGSTVSWYNWYLRQANTFVIILVVLCQYLNSYLFFFDSNQIFYNISVSADFLYTFIMFMQARTGHMIDGVEERNLLKVRDRYHKSLQFYLDIAGFLPINFLRFLVPGDDGPFYVAARQKAYVRMYYVLYYLKIREEEPGSSTVIYRSLKYTLLSTLLIHFLACGWYGLACSRAGSEGFSLSLCSSDSWIMILPQDLLQRIQTASDSVRGARDQVSFLHNTYITSLYWSSATTTSTGYGDIHAYTPGEKIYSIFAMILGMAILYGMTMGGFTSMLTNIDARRSSYVHRYTAFKQEVNSMGVSAEVKDLCLCYFDYLWHRWEGEDVQNSGVLEILPPSLQTSFSEATFKHLIQKADLLESTEDAFRRNLSLVSKSMVYLENQYIQRSGEIASAMCYIQSGIVEVLDSEEKNVVAVLHEGKLFGQILLVFDLPRINSIRCRTNCDIFVLDKHDFRQVLSEYPEAAKQFVEAARLKCDEGGRQWPMKAPSLSDFRHSTEKTNIRNRRMSLAAKMTSEVNPEDLDERRLTSVASNMDFTSSRRMTTVCSVKYEGVDLSRVIMHSKTREQQEIQDDMEEGVKPSFVDFVINGKTAHKTGLRSSTKLFDETELIAENANVEDLKDAVGKHVKLEDPDKTTVLERFASIVQIEPEGKFSRFWRIYLFCMSFFSGLYTTFMVFFETTPGMAMTYNGAALASLPLLSIATYSGEFDDVTVLQECGTSNQNQLIGCLKGLNTSFSNRITGNATDGYNVTIPGSYDVTFSGYNIETNGGILQIFVAYFLVDLSFYLNILINLRTAVKTPNGILTSFKGIKGHYMKWNRFGLDLLSVFPIEILAALFPLSRLGQHHLWIYLRINRAINFIRFVPTQFSKWEYSLDVQIVRIRITKFVVYIYTFTHLCSGFFYWWSCGYIIQSDQTLFPNKCRIGSWAWVFNRDFNTDSFEDYINTMYWASTTLTSTGYGDISASTTTGRMFALITMIIGTLLYGWLIAVIASTVSNSEAAIVSFMNSIESTKQYLQVHGVPDCLVNRVLDCRFLEWYRYRGTATPGVESIGRELPDALHGALLYESVNEFVKSLPFFYEVDSSFIAMLCGYAKSYHYAAGDVVIYEGDLSRNLCVIKQGHCFTVTSDLMQTIDHLRAGDYFGETELLFGCGSPRTVIADTPCEIIVFTREDIDKVLCCFPVLQSQMEKIEKNDAYRKNILDAIASRKAYAELGMDMSKRYNIETINCGISLYGEKVVDDPLVNTLSEEDTRQVKQMRSEINPILRLLSFPLLPFTFNPSSKSYIIYESIRCVLIVLTLFIVPLQAAILPNNIGLLSVQYILDFLCFVDQIIKLHTVYYNKKHIAVYNPVQTALNYLKTSFLVDFISWFPFEVFAMAGSTGPWTIQQWKFFATLRFTKVLQIYKVNKYFWYWMDDVRCQRRWIKHLSSVLYGLIIHHWMACLLFLTACPPDFYQNAELYADQSLFFSLNATVEPMYCHIQSWIGKIVTDDMVFPSLQLVTSYAEQYIVSIYWATATLVCVGYGDIHAERLAEMFMAILVMIFGTVYYSSILGEVAANIQTDDMQRGHYKGRLSDILKFFKVYHVDKETRKQVLNYYCYLWDRTQGVSPSYLLRGLPPSIRTSVCQSMYDDMIQEAFQQGDKRGSDEDQKEREGFFRLVSTRIQPSLFMKESVICRRGDVGEEMYFIQRGNVAIMDADDKNIAVVLGPGQHFGEVALLFASPRARTIIALTNCDLNVLSKTDLDEVLGKFPKFRDQMTSIAQDRRASSPGSSTNTHPSSKADVTMDIEVDQMKSSNDGAAKRKYLKILDRESRFSRVRCHVTVILSFISACIAIYQPCFQSHSSFLYTIGYLIDIWFVADMMISFHTSYLDKFSTNVTNRDEVHAHYAKDPRRFLFDAVINCPLEIFAHAVSSSGSTSVTYAARFAWISYLRVIRVLRMVKLLSICRMWEKDIRKDVLVVRMYKFLLSLAFLLHAAACIWYFVACPGGRCGEFSWVSTSKTDYITLGIMGYNAIPLIDSWYWATATMTSTGYGDIKPETLIEMIFSCFVMVGGKLVIGYVLGMVAATLANDESLRVWYEQRVASVKNYMTDLKFDQRLFDHVVQYYDYMWMKNQGVDVMKLFPDLPFGLCADIYNQIGRKMVDGLELFEGTSDNFRRHLCMVLHPTSFMPGDYICMQGDIRSEMYIVHRGIAESLKGDEYGNKVPLRLVQEGECFLAEGVLSKVRQSHSLRARTYVDVFTMSMNDLQGVIKYHPDARQKILENARRLYPTSKV